MSQFFWLTSQALDGLRYWWPITVVLSLLVVIAVVHTFLFKRSQFRKIHLFTFSPLLLSMLVLVWGSAMAHHGLGRGPAWASNVVGILWLLQIPLTIALIYFMRGVRLFATAVLLFELWFGSLCSFMAAMSVSNVWL